MWPQLTLLVLTAAGLALQLNDHKGGIDIATTIIASAILHTLLYFGGFYDVFSR